MTFQKYSIKTQIILGLIFTLCNILFPLSAQALQWPFFMDMIFVYAASFFGRPCGLIVGVSSSFFNAVVVQHSLRHVLYAVCCITGTLLTWLFITKQKTFENKVFFLIRLSLLFFVSTVVISFEGSLIYSIFFSRTEVKNENSTVLFLTYTLVLQNFGLILSAFLARLPVNLFDKALAVFGGFGCYAGVNALIHFWNSKKFHIKRGLKSDSNIAKKS